jgi:hypothetical protein
MLRVIKAVQDDNDVPEHYIINRITGYMLNGTNPDCYNSAL